MCGLLRDGDVAVERRGIRKTNGPVVDGWILGGQVYVYTCIYIYMHVFIRRMSIDVQKHAPIHVCLYVCMYACNRDLNTHLPLAFSRLLEYKIRSS